MSEAKIPIRATVFGSFGLASRNWRQMVRISWLPVLLSSLVAAWPLTRFPNRDLSGLSVEETTSALSVFNGLSMASTLTGLVLLTMVYVGLFRFFFREETPRLPFYLHWGIDEWRVLGATIVANVSIFAAVFAYMIGALVFSAILYGFSAALGFAPPLEELANLDAGGDAQMSAFLAIAVLWLLAVFAGLVGMAFWVAARVWFFLPAPVAEQRLDIGHLFKLSVGHAGRLVGILIVWSIVAYGAVLALGMGIDLVLSQGAIRDYVILASWSPAMGPLPFEPWDQMPRLIVGAILTNILLKLPLVMLAPLYVLTYLFRVEGEQGQGE